MDISMIILESYCIIMLSHIDTNQLVYDTPLSRFQYVVKNGYYNHSINLSWNTNISGLCKQRSCIIQ